MTRTPPFSPLTRDFYLRPTLTVARSLLGKLLIRRWRGVLLCGRIVEVEAYLGARDPASHAYRGRTPRNDVMFRVGGLLYVYFTYGMHYCCNVVTGPPGRGHAILIRALEPRGGIPVMARHRGVGTREQGRLCSGPARLCQALGITTAQDGTDLTGNRIWLSDDGTPASPIVRTTRVGISAGRHHLWRFTLAGNPWVSPGRPVPAETPA
jgi:DNA-3-methyladenine glycosylase